MVRTEGRDERFEAWIKVSISQREATELDSCHQDRMTLCTIPQLFY